MDTGAFKVQLPNLIDFPVPFVLNPWFNLPSVVHTQPTRDAFELSEDGWVISLKGMIWIL